MKNKQLFFGITLLAVASISGVAAAPQSTRAPALSTCVWTRVNDDDPSVTYSSGMQTNSNPEYYEKDMHSADAAGQWCKFSFTGTGVKWIGGRNADHGKAEVYLDGKLDATVDTAASSRLTQQELYTKTGLSDAPHLLMVQLKTSGYQDFDAFEYLAPPPAPPAPKNLGHILLPEQVPYLNIKHRYCVGNGVAMAVGEASGEWSQLAGPGYTTPNFISSEALTLEIDGVERPIRMEMKRAAETGVYYGVEVCGDLQVRLIDYACRGQQWISRLVMIDNTSKTTSHDLRLRAMVIPRAGAGMTNSLVEDANHGRCGIALKAGRAAQASFGGDAVTDKSVVICFTGSDGTAFLSTNTYTLETSLDRVAPGEGYHVSLCHYFRQDYTSDSECVETIRATNSVGDLETTITDWQSWFEHVGPGYQLGNIKDERAHDLVEGALAILKTNQSLDGGFIAHSTFYKEGYIRDAALGLRGLAATGHFDESKQWLIWVDHKFGLYGHIPDSASCEASLADTGGDFDMGNPNVEETALYLLCARDYYHATKDLDTLNAVHKSLQYCMDVQLKEAVANGYKLDFNGDETEICGAVNVSKAGTRMGTAAQAQDWSLSSIAVCAASLDFYREYLHARGEDATAYRNAQTGTTMNLNIEMTNLLKAMDDDFWRTDVPEIPGGFHDCFRIKSNNAWPLRRIVNFTLMPAFYGTPYSLDKKTADVSAIAQYFDQKTGFLQLVPGVNDGFDGHDLGYLLWGLKEVGDPRATLVYQALIDGPTADCWGSFNEAYSASGVPNDHDLRTLETGCNISAIAKYLNLGP